MPATRSPGRYDIVLGASITLKDALFSAITDVAYLGNSTFSGWDAFRDMLWDRLESSSITLTIINRDLSRLAENDRAIWRSLLDELTSEFPTKLAVETT